MTRREACLALLWPAWLLPRPHWQADGVNVIVESHRVFVTLRARREAERDSNTVMVSAWGGGQPLTAEERLRAERHGRELLARWLAEKQRSGP